MRAAASPLPARGERSKFAKRISGEGASRLKMSAGFLATPPHPDPLPASGARERAAVAATLLCTSPAAILRRQNVCATVAGSAMFQAGSLPTVGAVRDATGRKHDPIVDRRDRVLRAGDRGVRGGSGRDQ